MKFDFVIFDREERSKLLKEAFFFFLFFSGGFLKVKLKLIAAQKIDKFGPKRHQKTYYLMDYKSW